MNTVPVTVEVPTGGYCATFDLHRGLVNECPLLKLTSTEDKNGQDEEAFYCPLTTDVLCLREDKYGVLKWHDSEFMCPSLIQTKILDTQEVSV